MSTRGFKEQKLVINFLPPKTHFWKFQISSTLHINYGTNPFLGIIKESNSVERFSPFSDSGSHNDINYSTQRDTGKTKLGHFSSNRLTITVMEGLNGFYKNF